MLGYFPAYMHTPLVLSSLSVAYIQHITCVSGQLDTEHNSGLAVTLYLEHKAGIVPYENTPNANLRSSQSHTVTLNTSFCMVSDKHNETNTNENICRYSLL